MIARERKTEVSISSSEKASQLVYLGLLKSISHLLDFSCSSITAAAEVF